MWYEILYRILSIINYIILILIAIPVLVQLLYVVFAWVKKKQYPKSEKNGRIAYIIPAHNEASVIFNTVKDLMENQEYPKELYDVYVIADNCTDDTAALAEAAGARVLVHNDENPEHRMAAYPVQFAVDYLMKLEEEPYDFILRIDADNHVNKEFSSLMNDAFQSGVDLARSYEGSINATQNFYTKACSLFYIFDSRYGSRVRERIGIAAHINGSGSMMSMKMLKECGGFDALSISEDAEFNFNRMLEGYKGHYVEDAVCYEDMPSSFRDTLNRNRRIGSGSMKLLKTKLLKMLGKFFTTGNLSFVEMFLTYIFNFLTVILCTWIPLFYIYNFLFLYYAGYGYLPLTMFDASFYYHLFWNTIYIGGAIVLGLFVFFGIIQGVILVLIEYKKMGAKNRRELLSAALLFPVFLVLYAVTLGIGALSKPKWNKVRRSNERKK